MAEKILFVDDEENILHSIKRELRKRYDIDIATGGKEALEILKNNGPFAVIISDLRMPVMDGIQLLTIVKDIYPDTVRLMLTGNADQETAVEAVNKGQIFRFLNKPCPTNTLAVAIALALRQYRLITAEKELLDKTLKGAITVLFEVLSLANPIAFSSGMRIKALVVEMARSFGLGNIWQYEIAALVSQIGCITLPQDILSKVYSGEKLSEEEQKMYMDHPQIGAKLLEKIPRLEGVAAIVAHQTWDLQALNECRDLPEDVSIGAQILKIAIDFDHLHHCGWKRSEVITKLHEESARYNPQFLKILSSLKFSPEQEKIVAVEVHDLTVGMVVERDIMAANGVLIAPKGQEMTWSLIKGLKNFRHQTGIQEPIFVRVKQ